MQAAVEEYGLVPNQLTLNIMVSAFARRGEFESAKRWIEYVKSFGVTANSITFNSIFARMVGDTRRRYPHLVSAYLSR